MKPNKEFEGGLTKRIKKKKTLYLIKNKKGCEYRDIYKVLPLLLFFYNFLMNTYTKFIDNAWWYVIETTMHNCLQVK